MDVPAGLESRFSKVLAPIERKFVEVRIPSYLSNSEDEDGTPILLDDAGKRIRWFSTPVTVADEKWIEQKVRIEREVPDGLPVTAARYEMIFTVCRMIVDQDGDKFFDTIIDKDYLARIPSSVLAAIWDELNVATSRFDVVLGNSEPTPTE